MRVGHWTRGSKCRQMLPERQDHRDSIALAQSLCRDVLLLDFGHQCFRRHQRLSPQRGAIRKQQRPQNVALWNTLSHWGHVPEGDCETLAYLLFPLLSHLRSDWLPHHRCKAIWPLVHWLGPLQQAKGRLFCYLRCFVIHGHTRPSASWLFYQWKQLDLGFLPVLILLCFAFLFLRSVCLC